MARRPTRTAAVTSAEPAAPVEQPAEAAGLYDVTLNGRFVFGEVQYLPGHTHHVDKTILDAMQEAGKVEDVVEVS